MKSLFWLATLSVSCSALAQPSCTDPAVVSDVKMIFAENVIKVAEQQMAIRNSLDKLTTQGEIDASRERITAYLRLDGIIDTGDQGGGFPVWCSATIALKSAPQHAIRVDYRARASADHPSGVQTQARATIPSGPAGFNLLIGMRGALIK